MKTLRTLVIALAASVAASQSFSAITARGSDSTISVVKALADAFTQKTGITVDIQGGGSGAGAKAAIAGEVQLAFLSRGLDAGEISAGLNGTQYANDAVAIVVNKKNSVTNLTIAELKDYFTGAKTQWADGAPIVLFNRNADSGTRELFQEHVLGKGVAFAANASIKHDGVLLGSVARIPTSIAFDGLGHADPAVVKIISVNGVVPTPETVRSHAYPLTRTPTLATKGEATGEAKAFIDFATSSEGQAVVQSAGLLPLN